MRASSSSTGEIVVSAAVQAGHARRRPVAGRQDQNGGLVTATPEVAEEIQSLPAGQAKIQDQQVVAKAAKGRIGGLRVLHAVHGVAAAFQELAEPVRKLFVVFDEQDAHVHRLAFRGSAHQNSLGSMLPSRGPTRLGQQSWNGQG